MKHRTSYFGHIAGQPAGTTPALRPVHPLLRRWEAVAQAVPLPDMPERRAAREDTSALPLPSVVKRTPGFDASDFSSPQATSVPATPKIAVRASVTEVSASPPSPVPTASIRSSDRPALPAVAGPPALQTTSISRRTLSVPNKSVKQEKPVSQSVLPHTETRKRTPEKAPHTEPVPIIPANPLRPAALPTPGPTAAQFRPPDTPRRAVVYIGTVEIRMMPAPPASRPAPPRTLAASTSPPARDFVSPLGLRQS